LGRSVELPDAATDAESRMAHRRIRHHIISALAALASLLTLALWMSGADWRGVLLFAAIVTVAAWAPFGTTRARASQSLGPGHRRDSHAGVRVQSTR
jgi:hypothetical protein